MECTTADEVVLWYVSTYVCSSGKSGFIHQCHHNPFLLQADCFLTKTCSNGLRMAMVRIAVCSADYSPGTDSATACVQAGPLLADSKHPQADLAYFHKREFCFTLDGDIFVRYQSFKAGLSASSHTAAFTVYATTTILPAYKYTIPFQNALAGW